MANPRRHATTRRIVDEHFTEEAPHLPALPAHPYDAVLTVERRVSQDGMVAVGGNQYEPCPLWASFPMEKSLPGRGHHTTPHRRGPEPSRQAPHLLGRRIDRNPPGAGRQEPAQDRSQPSQAQSTGRAGRSPAVVTSRCPGRTAAPGLLRSSRGSPTGQCT
jgi:hypothetical protein